MCGWKKKGAQGFLGSLLAAVGTAHLYGTPELPGPPCIRPLLLWVTSLLVPKEKVARVS